VLIVTPTLTGLALAGEGSIADAPALQAALLAATEEHHPCALDLSELEAFDAAVLQLLVAAKLSSPDLAVRCSEHMRLALEKAGAWRVLCTP
jgi:anti-anti-sigma regulatory factor